MGVVNKILIFCFILLLFKLFTSSNWNLEESTPGVNDGSLYQVVLTKVSKRKINLCPFNWVQENDKDVFIIEVLNKDYQTSYTYQRQPIEEYLPKIIKW